MSESTRMLFHSQPGLGERRSEDETTMDCAAIHDLIPAYALNALPGEEVPGVRSHLASCPSCATSLAEYERIAAMMAHLAPQATPPPDVKAALFARIGQTHTAQRAVGRVTAITSSPARQGATLSLPASRPTMTSPPATEPPVPRARSSRRFGAPGRRTAWSARRSWRSYAMPVATTAMPLVLALAIVGGWGYSLRDDAASARDDQNFMGTFSSVLSGGDGNLYQLVSAAEVAGAEGQFLANPDGNDGILMVSGLVPQRAGQSYEVWIERDGEKFKYSDLDIDSRGNGQMLIEVTGSFKLCRGVYIQLAPVNDVFGNRSDVLWTSLTTPGPANGGKQTEGDPDLGSSNVATVQLASK